MIVGEDSSDMTESGRGSLTNVVFILTDDQGVWAAGCYGGRSVICPAEASFLFYLASQNVVVRTW